MRFYYKLALYLLCFIELFSQSALGMSSTHITTVDGPIFDWSSNTRDHNVSNLFENNLSRIAIQDYSSPLGMPSEWGNVRLIQESIAHTYGLDLSSTYIGGPCLPSLDSIDRSLHGCDVLPHEMSQTINDQTSVQAIYDATTNLTHAMQEMFRENVQDSCKIESRGQSLEQLIDVSSFQFSDLTAFDSNHAVESLSNKESSALLNSYGYQPRLECPEAIQRLELLMSPSSAPQALATQIEVSSGNDRMYQCYFRSEIGEEYRNFLWDSTGQFKPINTFARQEKALEILYPVIKGYFGCNRQGLIAYLEKQTSKGTPGFEQLLNWETGRATVGEHANNLRKTVSSSLAVVNVFQKTPTIKTIGNSTFVHGLSKMVANIRTGQFKEAKEVIVSFKDKIARTDIETRSQVIEEYNCLCAQYQALTEKAFEKYKDDPRYLRYGQQCDRGTMSLAEAFKILDARHHVAHSLAYRMGYNPKELSAHDKSLLYKAIDSKTKDSFGLQDLYEHKDLLKDTELNKLKEKLECFEGQQKTKDSLAKSAPEVAQINHESTAVAPQEETESIERPIESAQQASLITANPPPLEPQDPQEKDDGTKEIENADLQKEGIKETSIYKRAADAIERNTQRFEKLNLKNLSKKDLQHIINNHTKIGEISQKRSMSNKTSLFNEDIDLIDLILEAWESGIEIKNGVREYDCGRIIGTSKDGIPTSVIKVCLNGTKDAIRTAYPR
ncbi:hypothetical protein BH09DEP1_BH09DEP1_5120 [soil metagenome]